MSLHFVRDTGTGSRPSTPDELGLGRKPLAAKQGDPPSVHVRARLDAQVRALLAHEEGTRSGSDPEDLHQMRVAVRRMRAALKADGAALDSAPHLQAELRWLGGALGPVRDLDVQLERLRADAEGFDEAERDAVEQLLTGLVAERTSARRRMLAALRSKRYAALLRSLAEAVVSDPVEPRATGRPEGKSKRDRKSARAQAPTAADLVERPYRKLRKAITTLDEQPADDDLHALRIQGKRLRYAAELASPTGGKRVRRLIEATRALQDVLGEHQDATIAEHQIRRLLHERSDALGLDAVFVAGRLVERERARKANYRAVWRDAWHEVDRRALSLLSS